MRKKTSTLGGRASKNFEMLANHSCDINMHYDTYEVTKEKMNYMNCDINQLNKFFNRIHTPNENQNVQSNIDEEIMKLKEQLK